MYIIDMEACELPVKKPVKKRVVKTKGDSPQQLFDHWWRDAVNKYVSLNRYLIFFYNSPTAEAEYNEAKAIKTAEIFEKTGAIVTKSPFETEDNMKTVKSYQAWRPNYETAEWNDIYPVKDKKPVKKRVVKTKPTSVHTPDYGPFTPTGEHVDITHEIIVL